MGKAEIGNSIIGAIKNTTASKVSLVVPEEANIVLGDDCSSMFSGCKKIVSVDLSGLNTSSVTNMNSMFEECSALKTLDLSSFNTEKVTNMGGMFRYGGALIIDVSSFNIEKVTNMLSMFGECQALTTIYAAPGADWSGVESSRFMFSNCSNLKGGNGTTNGDSDASYARIDKEGQPGYFTEAYARVGGKLCTDVYSTIEAILAATGYTEIVLSSQVKDYELGDVSTENTIINAINLNGNSGARFSLVVPQGADIVLNNLCNSKFGSCTKLVSADLRGLDVSFVTEFTYMFYGCSSLTSLNLSGWNTEYVEDMSGMFGGCSALTTLYLSGFNTEAVTNMNSMFDGCSALTTLDLSSFNTEAVTDMNSMFKGCSELTTIYAAPGADWNRSGLSSSDMFTGCSKLVGGNGTQCDTSSVKDATRAHIDGGEANPGYFTEPYATVGGRAYFDAATTIAAIQYATADSICVALSGQVSATDLGKAATENSIIGAIKNTTASKVSLVVPEGANIALNADCKKMFAVCRNLVSADLRGFNTANVADMDSLFQGCSALTTLDLSSFNTSNVTDMSGMFNGCSALTTLDVNSFNTSNVTNMKSMFAHCRKLTALDLSSFNTAKVTNMRSMFDGCWVLTTLDVNSFNTSNVTDMYYMFSSTALVTLDLSSFNTEKVTNMYCMFCGCDKLSTIYAAADANWGASSVLEEKEEMFLGCENLTGGNGTCGYGELNIEADYARIDKAGQPGYFTAKYAVVGGVICSDLTATLNAIDDATGTTEIVLTGAVSAYDLGNAELGNTIINAIKTNSFEDARFRLVVPESANIMLRDRECEEMFRDCSKLVSADLRGLNTENVTYMDNMFYGCRLLTTLDLSGFNTENVYEMSSMFNGCRQLTTLNLSSFNTSNVENMCSMFDDCESLTTLDLSSFNTSRVENMSDMFIDCISLKTIYAAAGANWNRAGLTSDRMFYDCTSLVGGHGTQCDGQNNIDATRACIDVLDGQSGYFTLKYATVGGAICSDKASTIDSILSAKTNTTIEVVLSGAVSAEDLGSATESRTIINAIQNSQAYVKLVVPEGANIVLGADCSGMFQSCTKLVSADLRGLNTSNVTDMQSMFYSCSELTTLNLSSFNTEDVTNMKQMFTYCSKLTTLDLSSFNTSKVENMSWMFASCSALTTIYAAAGANWNKNGLSSGYMFDGCSALKGDSGTTWGDSYKDAARAKVDGGTGNEGYFTGPYAIVGGRAYTDAASTIAAIRNATDSIGVVLTSKVTTADLGKAETVNTILFAIRATSAPKVSLVVPEGANIVLDADCAEMFYSCRKLVSVDLRGLNTSNVANMKLMFYGCSALTELDLSSFNTSNDTTMSDMFYGCSSLTTLNVSGFNTDNVTNMSGMFGGCSALPTLNLSNFNTSNVKDMSDMFNGCYALTSLNVSSFNTSSVTNMSLMFSDCDSITELDLSNFNTSKVTNMSGMFSDCGKLISLDLSNFNTSKVTNMDRMFSECDTLAVLDLRGFSVSSATNLEDMFADCKNLTTIYVDEGADWSVVSDESSSGMFMVCEKLKGGNGTAYSYDNRTAAYARVDGLNGQPGYFTELVYAQVDSVNCYDLAALIDSINNARSDIKVVLSKMVSATDLGSASTSGTILNAIKNCSQKVNLVVSEYANIALSGDCSSLFSGFTNLRSADLRGLRTDSVTSMASMFSGCSALVWANLGSFNTEKVTNASSMFSGCQNLEIVRVAEDADWSGIAQSTNMFDGCTKLTGSHGTTYDASHTNASYAKVDGLNGANGYFSAVLPYAIVGGVKYNDLQSTIRAIEDAIGSFEVVLSDKVSAADLGKRDGQSYNTICNALRGGEEISLVVPVDANIELAADCKDMFYGSSLVSADLRGFNTSRVTNMSRMFYDCDRLKTVNLSNFNTSNVTDMSYMFFECELLASLDLSSFNTEKVTDMTYMFSSCNKLESIDLSGFNTDNVTSMGYMFAYGGLKSIDLSNFNTSSVTTFECMFANCDSLTTLDLSGFNTSSVTSFDRMFQSCDSLKTLNLSGFDVSQAIFLSSMFADCGKLTTIYVESGADWSGNTLCSSACMFENCDSLVGGNGTVYDNAHLNVTYAKVDGGSGNEGYFTALISYYITPGLDDYTGHTGLTAAQALPNINSALAKISAEGSAGTTYSLKINGGITGQQAIGDSLDGKAGRIVLEGVTGNAVDSLYGDNAGSVLTIATTVPVEIRNLKITGGYAVDGGGVYVDNGDVTIGRGTLIANNKAVGTSGDNARGGGIYVGGGSVRMADGIISGNQTAATAAVNNCGAGVFINEGGSFTMDGGAIIDNTAKGAAGVGGLGGGVFVSIGSTFRMNAGTISGNIVEKGRQTGGYEGTGAGVYVVSDVSEGQGTFIMSGMAQIASNNDVYLSEGAVITIAGPLTNSNVATITPETYSTEIQIIKIAEGVTDTKLVWEFQKFVVTPNSANSWFVQDNGKFTSWQLYIYEENDAAHPYVLSYDENFNIDGVAAGYPEVYVGGDEIASDRNYYLIMRGYHRISPLYNGGLLLRNTNAGKTFTFHITLEGDNIISTEATGTSTFEIVGPTSGTSNVNVIFDAATAGGKLTLNGDKDFKVSENVTVTYTVADGFLFSGTIGSTTYTDITAFFTAANNNNNGCSFTITKQQ